MALTAGIIGLPNVGKSTLFNAITQGGAIAANYPFATIDPNVGIVEVPDTRLQTLTELFAPQKTVPATFEFTDIAGLVKGASLGEGLGNQFLSHIREVDAIVQVVRAFDNDDITHVEGNVDPVRDMEIINNELIFADLEIIEKRMKRLAKLAEIKDKNAMIEYPALVRIHEAFMEGKPARSIRLHDAELPYINQLTLLTMKPMLYVANLSEDEIASFTDNPYYQKIEAFAANDDAKVLPISAQVEADVAELDDADKPEFLHELGLAESGIDRLSKAAYHLLGLATYFTAGKQEVHAWTFHRGMKAPACAGIIHSDFERGFIKAEVICFTDLVACGSEAAARSAGKYRMEGKDYEMKDGDIVHFRFNV